MRAFIALELPEDFSWELSQLARGLARHAEGHFVDAEQYHITLAFLGDIGETQARDAIAALDAACAGRAAVPLASAGLGSFGRGRSTTLYLALHKEPQLMALAEDLRAELARCGLSFDEKPFLPHVTIARRARVQGGELAALPFPNEALATRVTLFKSTLTPDGPLYKELYAVELDAED